MGLLKLSCIGLITNWNIQTLIKVISEYLIDFFFLMKNRVLICKINIFQLTLLIFLEWYFLLENKQAYTELHKNMSWTMQIIIFSSSDSCHSLLPINVSSTSEYLENLPNFSAITHSLYCLWDLFETWMLCCCSPSANPIPSSFLRLKVGKCKASHFSISGLHFSSVCTFPKECC